MSDLDRDDPTFLEDLRRSNTSVEIAAKWLAGRGHPVIVRPVIERPDPSVRGEYGDDGDLEIIQRVEVKQRIGLTFTSKDDFPYPTIIVDVCHSYDRARPKPYAYIILNREMSGALIVDVKTTRRDWVKVDKFDRHTNRQRSFYECPLELVSYESMIEGEVA